MKETTKMYQIRVTKDSRLDLGWEKQDHREQNWNNVLHLNVNCVLGHVPVSAIGVLVS